MLSNRSVLLLNILSISLSTFSNSAHSFEPENVHAQYYQDAKPGWELNWHDEFDQDGRPNPANWSYEHGYVRNNEAQFYTTDRAKNARVENGHLLIQSHKETHPPSDINMDEASRSAWRGISSASITTQHKLDIHYGRLEVRAQLPVVYGAWSAIWTLGKNFNEVNWPKTGELDIAERYGSRPNKTSSNVHTEKYNHMIGTGKGEEIELNNPLDFHVYAMEWSEDRIDFFVDDNKYFTFNREPGEDAWPFDKPAYLIMNLAFEGYTKPEKVDQTITYKVDYVRYYKRNEKIASNPKI